MTALSRALACQAWIVSSGVLTGAGQRVVDERGDPAARCREGAAVEILDRLQALELHVHVGVHVDGARQQIEARDIDFPLRRAEVEAEARDPAALDADVGVEGVAGGYDRAAAQDQVHRTRSPPRRSALSATSMRAGVMAHFSRTATGPYSVFGGSAFGRGDPLSNTAIPSGNATQGCLLSFQTTRPGSSKPGSPKQPTATP